jgi:hypothetical protein
MRRTIPAAVERRMVAAETISRVVRATNESVTEC